MEGRDITVSREALKQLVIVSDARDNPETEDVDICSGFVSLKSAGFVYVITSMEFVKEREEHLIVRFFDTIQQRALVVARGKMFCMLRTEFHRRCESIKPAKDSISPSRALTFPPCSVANFQTIPCFINLECVTAHDDDNDFIEESQKYMVVTCHHGERCKNGISRLIGAPIFSMEGYVLGLFVGNCRHDDPFAAVFKLALSIHYIGDIMECLMAQLKEDGVAMISKRSDASDTSSKNETIANKRKRGSDEGTSWSKRSYSSEKKRVGSERISKYKSANKKRFHGGYTCRRKTYHN